MDVLIDGYDHEQLKDEIPEFDIGDTVRISTRIVEGEKERIQIFQGTVIARKGRGLAETFSIHRVSYGEGMERVFYLHSPRIVKIQVVKKGAVRRSKLYYLRGRTGKKAKVREKITSKKASRAENEKDYSTKTPNDIEMIASGSVAEPVESAAQE
jgi:large subunit ribosomal protein L19